MPCVFSTRARPGAAASNRGEHLLGGRLAVAAGDGDDAAGPAAARRTRRDRRARAACRRRPGRAPASTPAGTMIDQHRRGAARQRGGGEGMAVVRARRAGRRRARRARARRESVHTARATGAPAAAPCRRAPVAVAISCPVQPIEGLSRARAPPPLPWRHDALDAKVQGQRRDPPATAPGSGVLRGPRSPSPRRAPPSHRPGRAPARRACGRPRKLGTPPGAAISSITASDVGAGSTAAARRSAGAGGGAASAGVDRGRIPRRVEAVLGDGAEYRRRDDAAVGRGARRVDHHEDHEARDPRPARSRRTTTCGRARSSGRWPDRPSAPCRSCRRRGSRRSRACLPVPLLDDAAPAARSPSRRSAREMTRRSTCGVDRRSGRCRRRSVMRSHHVRPHQAAAVGDGGEGARQLQRGHGDALAERRRHQVDAAPLVDRAQEAGGFAGQVDAGGRAEAEALAPPRRSARGRGARRPWRSRCCSTRR